MGGAGNDQLVGNGGDDVLSGDTGNDTLTGGNGNDTLIGGANLDVLTGGTGSDLFRFSGTEELAAVGTNGQAGGEDGITDFAVVDDTIEFLLSGFSFVGIGPGTLPGLNFVNGDIDNAYGYGTSNGQTTFVLDAAGFSSALVPGTSGTLYVDIAGDGIVDYRVASFGNGSSLGSFSAADILLS